jgi:hypothetical protein
MARSKLNLEVIQARLASTDFVLVGDWRGITTKNTFRCKSTGRLGLAFPQVIMAQSTPVWAQKSPVKRGRPPKSKQAKRQA